MNKVTSTIKLASLLLLISLSNISAMEERLEGYGLDQDFAAFTMEDIEYSLSNPTKVRHYHIRDRILTLEVLKKILQDHPKLEKISLSKNADITAEAKRHLNDFPDIRFKSFRTHISLSPDTKEDLSTIIAQYPNLKSIGFKNHSPITKENLEYLIDNCQNLEEIKLGWFCENIREHNLVNLQRYAFSKNKKINIHW